MRKLMMYSTYMAVLAMVSMGHVQAACGGGGYKTAGKTTPATPVPKETASASAVDAIYYSLDSSRFDSVSATLDLSKGQAQQVSNAVSEINEKGAKLAKAQTNAQNKLDHCSGNCESELRNLARATTDLKNYDSGIEFDLRLRGILHRSQAATYFHS